MDVETDGEQIGRIRAVVGELQRKQFASRVDVQALLQDYLQITGTLH